MDFAAFKKQYQLRLDPQQEAAVQAVEGPVLLLAVPGSGKTTVLVSRIGYMRHALGIPARSILTMTYTVAAARDMKQRYASFFGEDPQLEFRTINGVCSRILGLFERTTGRKVFDLLEDGSRKSALLAELCRQQTKEFTSEGVIKAVETAITYVKNSMLEDEELDKVEVEGVDFPKLYRSYCRALRQQGLMDFDDQMVYALRILQQHPEILDAVRRRWHYFCVDEAQDTSRIQHTIIRLLAQGSGSLFMVGDEDQSIYGFRAAYPQALTRFDRLYPGARILYMERNYRSTPEIVTAADGFIRKNKNRHPKHMEAVRDSGPRVEKLELYNRQKQYASLCSLARSCREQTAVLYRDNDSVLPLIDLLDREGIPYRCRQVDSLFFTSRIVRDITGIIRFAQDPCDGRLFQELYYKLGAGISRTLAQEACRQSARSGEPILELLARAGGASSWTRMQCKSLRTHLHNLLEERADKAVYRIVRFMGYGDYLEKRGMDPGKCAILEALGTREPSPADLLRRLEELQAVIRKGSAGGSRCPLILSTIHSSKGLEYKNVVLMDILDGVFPREVPGRGASPEELEAFEEERRLFYVGMTRARDRLTLITFKSPGCPSAFAQDLFPEERRRAVRQHEEVTPTLLDRPTVGGGKADPAEDYGPGTRVLHRSFGPGQLMSRSGDIAVIRFDSGDVKKLSLSTALRRRQLTLE